MKANVFDAIISWPESDWEPGRQPLPCAPQLSKNRLRGAIALSPPCAGLSPTASPHYPHYLQAGVGTAFPLLVNTPLTLSLNVAVVHSVVIWSPSPGPQNGSGLVP